MAHLLFLSHAGADTEPALRLAAAIETSPDAQKHGLKVWVDKRPDGPHRLQAGTPWQDQLERAIATELHRLWPAADPRGCPQLGPARGARSP